MLGFTYSHMYKDIQTGVRQEIVYGQKHRKGHSLMPSLEYSKRDLLTKGLDVALTVNYNKNETTNGYCLIQVQLVWAEGADELSR